MTFDSLASAQHRGDPLAWSEEDRTLRQACEQMLSREVASEMAWRVPTICMIAAAVTVLTAAFYQLRTPALAGSALVVAISEMVLLLLMFQQRSLNRLYFTSFLMAVTSLLWWSMLSFFRLGPPVLSEVVLLSLSLGLGRIAWPFKYSSALVALLCGLSLTQALVSEHPVIFMIAAVMIALTSLQASAVSYLSLASRAGLPVLVRICESFASVISTVRVLAWQMLILGDSARALVIAEQQRADIVSEHGAKPSLVDKVFINGLAVKIKEQEGEEGILTYQQLGEQFLPALLDWFGTVPSKLYYTSFIAVVADREEQICLVLPCSAGSRIAGVMRAQRALMAFSGVVRVALGAARNRFLSSDVLLAAERSVSDREQETNQLIHLVNNVAQEMSIVCENIKEDLGISEKAPSAQSAITVHKQLLEHTYQLEASIRNLSAGVSDLKWLKELLRLKEAIRTEYVRVTPVLDDIEFYGKYRAERKGEQFRVINEIGKVGRELSVQVCSREFLEASLRLLIRVASRRLGENKQISIRVFDEGSKVVFEVGDSGVALDEEMKRRLLAGAALPASGRTGLETFVRGVVNLARVSSGECVFVPARSELTNIIQIRLEALVQPQAVSGENNSQWILLVDDKPEVTTFYSRVAEALELPYKTAASVDAAKDLVTKHGVPRMVITDIQLGESSGLDLVRHLRSEFGAELPIIVVSGHTETGVAEEVHSAGATKYLTKPVGRRKLFSEINEILGR